MPRQIKVISNMRKSAPRTYTIITPEEKIRHMKNIIGSVLHDAQNIWADIWSEFQGSVTQGVMVSPEAQKGNFVPKCGWPEFLEKMWQLKHHLDYVERFCNEK